MICREGEAVGYLAALDPLLTLEVLEFDDDEPEFVAADLDDSDEELVDDESPDEGVDVVDSPPPIELPLFEPPPRPFPPLRLSVT